MSDPLTTLIIIACLGVLVILALGLGTFGKGGPGSGERSNRLMRYRIIGQAVAVALVVLLLVLRGNGGAG